jgi:hypothetical protein
MKQKINKALKAFMQEHFDFSTLKKIGFYPKEIKFNDYEGQAKRVCEILGLESVYEYGKEEIRCHISYVENKTIVDENGNLKPEHPFIETFFPNQLHIQ